MSTGARTDEPSSPGLNAGAAAPRARKPTGGLFGRVPKTLILATELRPETKFLLAYRSLHTGSKWGCAHAAMSNTVRAGFSSGLFKRAVKEAKDRGLLVRHQGLKKPNRDARGRGLAIDQLTFEKPDKDYVMVERDLFDGALAPREIICFLYLRLRGAKLAEPWQIAKQFCSKKGRPASRPTVNSYLAALTDKGLVKNYGTRQEPQWGLVSLKNPTFKNPTFKKVTFKKTTHSHKTSPSHQISPPQVTVSQHIGASPAVVEHKQGRTDLGSGQVGSALPPQARAANDTGLAMGSPPLRLPFSTDVIKEAEALGVDFEELVDRYQEFAAKTAAKGRPIADPSAYLLKMARDKCAKPDASDPEELARAIENLKGIASPNEWARAAAFTRVARTPPPLPAEKVRARIADQLRKDGLDPGTVEAEWSKAYAERRTKSEYRVFADAKRDAARRGVRRAA
jgi:hypothetical protein